MRRKGGRLTGGTADPKLVDLLPEGIKGVAEARGDRLLTAALHEDRAEGLVKTLVIAGGLKEKTAARYVVHIIQYPWTDAKGKVQQARLLTSLVDAVAHPAAELVLLYHQRWEQELVFAEIKAQRASRPMHIRAHDPLRVCQEIDALLLGHYTLRWVMLQAARQAGVPPVQLSFSDSLPVLEVRLARIPARPTEAKQWWPRWWQELLTEMGRQRLRPRRPRRCLGARKVTRTHWPVKKQQEEGTIPKLEIVPAANALPERLQSPCTVCPYLAVLETASGAVSTSKAGKQGHTSTASKTPMSSTDCITRWIQEIKDGDQADVQKLLERYFQQLVQMARKKLQALPQLADYGEDVALSALKSLVLGAQRGRFEQLRDREGLWRLLVVLTLRKAVDLLRKERRYQQQGEVDIAELISHEPTPALALQMADECRLLDTLGDDELRAIALWKMEGHSNDEIAGKLDCTPRTVGRRLQFIRQIWEAEMAT